MKLKQIGDRKLLQKSSVIVNAGCLIVFNTIMEFVSFIQSYVKLAIISTHLKVSNMRKCNSYTSKFNKMFTNYTKMN
jgi:hypothetical protein